MATVGWGLYTLAFDVLGVPGPEAALAALSAGGQDGSLALLLEGARLWLAAHALGVGLWLASRRTSHPVLFPTFALLLTLATHAVRLAAGTTLAEARAGQWFMEEAEGQVSLTLTLALTLTLTLSLTLTLTLTTDPGY